MIINDTDCYRSCPIRWLVTGPSRLESVLLLFLLLAFIHLYDLDRVVLQSVHSRLRGHQAEVLDLRFLILRARLEHGVGIFCLGACWLLNEDVLDAVWILEFLAGHRREDAFVSLASKGLVCGLHLREFDDLRLGRGKFALGRTGLLVAQNLLLFELFLG